MLKLGVMPRDANVAREIWKRLRPETKWTLAGVFEDARLVDVARVERAAREGALH